MACNIHDTAWHAKIWHGMAREAMTWHDMARGHPDNKTTIFLGGQVGEIG